MAEVHPRCVPLNQQNMCLIVIIFESLLSLTGILLCSLGISEGEAQFRASDANVLEYGYLVPIIVIASLWFLTLLIAFSALKCTIPYLMLPYLIMSLVVFLSSVALLVYTASTVLSNEHVPWPGVVILIVMAIFVGIQLYCSNLKLNAFKALVKRKKAVQGTAGEKPAVVGSNSSGADRHQSFSRRSTVIITDEFLELPPKL